MKKYLKRISVGLMAAVAVAYSYALPVIAAGPLGSADGLGLPTKKANEAALNTIFNTALMVAGAIAVIMIIYGGFLYITSNGDASKTTTAKNLILYTAVGVVIIAFAFVIVRFVIGNF